MSSIMEHHEAAAATAAAPSRELSAVLSRRWALQWRHLAVTVFFAAIFMYLNYLPLANSTVWVDVGLGQWTLDYGRLPAADPLQPMAEGMALIDTAWLGRVLAATAASWASPEWLSHGFALAALATLLLLARAYWLRSRRLALTSAGVALVLAAGGAAFAAPGIDVLGLLCFALLLWLIETRQPHGEAAAGDRWTMVRQWAFWPALATLFVFWANVHGSFLFGASLLACLAIGGGVQAAARQRSLAAAFRDPASRTWLLAAELGLAAALLNPYGAGIYSENLRLLSDAALKQTPAGAPLALASPLGVVFLLSIVGAAAALRMSRRRVAGGEMLALTAMGGLVVVAARWLPWYAAAYGFVMLPYFADAVRRRFPQKSPRPVAPEGEPLTPRHFAVSLVCLLVIWCAFALAPISHAVLGGAPREGVQLYGQRAPLAAADYLKAHPPQGLVYAPPDWSDFLLGRQLAPAGVLATSSVQWLPRSVWADHQRIARLEAGWDRALKRYDVETVVVDKLNQASLLAGVRQSPEWWVYYEDNQALVARRADAAQLPGAAAEELE